VYKTPGLLAVSTLTASDNTPALPVLRCCAAQNGPHQGAERTNIMYSTGHMLRQCKASVFEGGIRVPGILHLPVGVDSAIRPRGSINVTTPAGALDVLPTILDLLAVNFSKTSENPSWVIDGTSMLPFVKPGSDPNAPRRHPLIFSFGTHVSCCLIARLHAPFSQSTRVRAGTLAHLYSLCLLAFRSTHRPPLRLVAAFLSRLQTDQSAPPPRALKLGQHEPAGRCG
jgi:hypothetical protein